MRRAIAPLYEYARARDLNYYHGVYADRAAALAAASERARVGYDHPETADLYRAEVVRMRTSDYPVVYWLARHLVPGARVFDWGGNLGHAYYTYRAYLTYPPDLRWTICDVAEVVRAGERRAREERAAGLDFTTAPRDADGADVVLASGALQYIPDSIGALLSSLARKPAAVFVNRTPVHPTLGYFTVQDIGPTVCAYQIFAEPALLAEMRAAGYVLRDRWECHGTFVRIPRHPSRTLEAFAGFYFERA